jgi:hypothetical protein
MAANTTPSDGRIRSLIDRLIRPRELEHSFGIIPSCGQSPPTIRLATNRGEPLEEALSARSFPVS